MAADQPEDRLSESLSQELARLESLIDRSGPEHADDLRAAAEKMKIAVEELHVTEEELRQQNDELLATQEALETQRRRYQDLFETLPPTATW